MPEGADSRPPFYRLTLSAGLLLLADAAVLAVLGVRSGRPLLIGVAAASLVLAAALFRLWQRHQRRWAEVRQARMAVQAEVRALSALLRERDPPETSA